MEQTEESSTMGTTLQIHLTKTCQRVNTIRPISVTEFNEAETEILRLVQIKSYRDELTRVTHSEQPNCQRKTKSMKKSSSIYKLDPILIFSA